jgi:PAS domain S-box-containing protein
VRVVVVAVVSLAGVLVALLAEDLAGWVRVAIVAAVGVLAALAVRPSSAARDAIEPTVAAPQPEGTEATRVTAARLSMVLDDYQAPLTLLAGDLARSVWDGCRFDVRDEDGSLRRVAVASARPGALGESIDTTMAKVAADGEAARWDGGYAVALRDAGGVLGAMAVAPAAATASDVDIATAHEIGAMVATTIGRVQLLRQTRRAVRRSQRIARQLHQLIAASIAVAGLRGEDEVVPRLARSVRGVFDAEEVIVTLDEGPAAPLRVVATRSGEQLTHTAEAANVTGVPAPPRVEADLRAVRRDGWLVLPILVRRGLSQGTVAVRRSADGAFSEDDVEVLTLLSQMASSSLDASEQDRTILRGEARWRVLVEAAPVGLVEVDRTGTVQWWNRAGASILGWPLVSEHPAPVVIPDGLVAPLAAVRTEALADGTAAAREVPEVRIGETVRDLTAAAASMEHDEGEPSALLLIDDVTEQRRLVDELHHAQRMEVIGQLASSVAHDFNNLLTLISGYAELLSHSAGADDRTHQLTDDIQAATTRASTLTGKLLTIGRTKTPAPVKFAPAAIIGSIGEVLARILGTAVELRLELDSTNATIQADPDQFEQTVLNLAMNARDAMPDGGTLTITVSDRSVDDAVAAERELTAGSYVQLLIVDTGEGMDDETARRCFEPLFTTKGPSKGTGLGLPAAKRVVTESGGSIVCRSRLGEGTTFDILLPSFEGEIERRAPEGEPTVRPQPATVLVAEDEPGIRSLVTRVLTHNGYEVLEAESGEDALSLANKHTDPIHVLVSDVVMGAMSGKELASELQVARPDLLVVLASGNVDASILEGLREGSATFLAKPFRPSEVLEAVAALQSRRRRTTAESDST